jgi:hypothetical protein
VASSSDDDDRLHFSDDIESDGGFTHEDSPLATGFITTTKVLAAASRLHRCGAISVDTHRVGYLQHPIAFGGYPFYFQKEATELVGMIHQ